MLVSWTKIWRSIRPQSAEVVISYRWTLQKQSTTKIYVVIYVSMVIRSPTLRYIRIYSQVRYRRRYTLPRSLRATLGFEFSPLTEMYNEMLTSKNVEGIYHKYNRKQSAIIIIIRTDLINCHPPALVAASMETSASRQPLLISLHFLRSQVS